MTWEDHLPAELKKLYEIRDYKHAAAILAKEFPIEFQEVCQALQEFRFTKEMVQAPGGNESEIPKAFSDILRPMGWAERQLNAKLIVDGQEISTDTHKIDYIKGRVAFDLEWNSKDQTFDRDLYAFRAFFEYDRISLGILVTRSNELDPWFEQLGTYRDKHGVQRKYKDKFGASTTHMGKLLSRIESGRGGGCPILVFGITTNLLKQK
ncbi:MAG: BglII/BstYI family type II restriction endonuclease [Spirochaetota bacterium]